MPVEAVGNYFCLPHCSYSGAPPAYSRRLNSPLFLCLRRFFCFGANRSSRHKSPELCHPWRGYKLTTARDDECCDSAKNADTAPLPAVSIRESPGPWPLALPTKLRGAENLCQKNYQTRPQFQQSSSPFPGGEWVRSRSRPPPRRKKSLLCCSDVPSQFQRGFRLRVGTIVAFFQRNRLDHPPREAMFVLQRRQFQLK